MGRTVVIWAADNGHAHLLPIRLPSRGLHGYAALLPHVHSLGVSLAHFPMVMLELVGVASFFYYAVEKPFDLKKRVSGSALEDVRDACIALWRTVEVRAGDG